MVAPRSVEIHYFRHLRTYTIFSMMAKRCDFFPINVPTFRKKLDLVPVSSRHAPPRPRMGPLRAAFSRCFYLPTPFRGLRVAPKRVAE